MTTKTIFIQIFLVICINTFCIKANSSTLEHQSSMKNKEDYQCTPCGQDCDKEIYTKPGKCTHCQMALVKTSTIHFKTIQPSEICKYIQNHPNVILLDVRTKEEFEGKAEPNFGTLKNAINLPIQDFKLNLSSLNRFKNKNIIVYCSHSHRSPQASYMLTQNGFTNITNLAGGMSVLNDSSCKK
jgi:rhodanese-related sulfurtransferase